MMILELQSSISLLTRKRSVQQLNINLLRNGELQALVMDSSTEHMASPLIRQVMYMSLISTIIEFKSLTLMATLSQHGVLLEKAMENSFGQWVSQLTG